MTRLQEANEFYGTIIPPSLNPEAANVMRQASIPRHRQGTEYKKAMEAVANRA